MWHLRGFDLTHWHRFENQPRKIFMGRGVIEINSIQCIFSPPLYRERLFNFLVQAKMEPGSVEAAHELIVIL